MPFVGKFQRFMGQVGPWFIHGKNIGTFLEAVGAAFDTAITSLDQGLRLSQPLRCDVSALPVLAKDRGIRLYPTEATSSKRLRLSKWLELHRTRGTHIGEMKHSQPYFLPNTPVMRIVHQDGGGATATWWTLEADGTAEIVQTTPSNWKYYQDASKWSRFWVILYAPANFLDLATWDDGSTYDGGTDFYDGLINAQVAQDLVQMILEWKAPHSRLAGYIIATDPTSFDPSGTATTDPTGWTSLPTAGNPWYPAATPPPVSHRTRLPSAVWIYEDNTP